MIKITLSADRDFIAFLDGSEIMRKHTSNPILPDEFKTKLHLTAGVHDFCCVFSSNYGSGWGICCRFTATGKAKPPVFLATDDLN